MLESKKEIESKFDRRTEEGNVLIMIKFYNYVGGKELRREMSFLGVYYLMADN